MDPVMSEQVQHGLQSWVDYDRPWFLRRQFLVSQKQSSILTNLVAIALSLVGPRLWILIKALFFYGIDIFTKVFRRSHEPSAQTSLLLASRVSHPHSSTNHSNGVNQPQPASLGPGRHARFTNESLDITDRSHSEFEAAFALLHNIWKFLRSGRLQLSGAPPNSYNRWLKPAAIPRFWRNFLQRPIDVLVSLSLSILFVGVFVAESTGTVLSASIVGGTTALVSSPKCNLRWGFFQDSDAFAYTQKCYHAKRGEDGCNFFRNQSITFTERSGQCLFPSPTCASQNHSALVLDTGLIDARHIGINTASQLQFRRTTRCSPLKPDGEYLKMNEVNRIIHPKGLLMYDSAFYGRRENVTILDWEGIVGLAHAVCNPADVMGKLTQSGDSHGSLTNSSYIIVLIFISKGVVYDKVREDTVFPATDRFEFQDRGIQSPSQVAFQNDGQIGILGCIENAYICDKGLSKCWDHPTGPLDQPLKLSADPRTSDYGLPMEFAKKMQIPVPLHNGRTGETSFIPISRVDAGGSRPTEAELARLLLSRALLGSNMCQPSGANLEIHSICSNRRICHNIPQDQWKVEIRRNFETSLAQVQYNVLDAVRGRESVEGSGLIRDYDGIPKGFEGLCKMGKFNSVGWRNVSVWGIVGLLAFAAGVSLASMQTEEEELWFVVGVAQVNHIVRWGIQKFLQLPWWRAWRYIVELSTRVGRISRCL